MQCVRLQTSPKAIFNLIVPPFNCVYFYISLESYVDQVIALYKHTSPNNESSTFCDIALNKKKTCPNHQSFTFCDIALNKQLCPNHQSSTFCDIALHKQTSPNHQGPVS